MAFVLSYALSLLSVASSFVAESWMPAPLKEYLESERNAEFSAGDGTLIAILLPFLMITFVSFIAMLKFWRWSRELAVASSILGFVLIPFLGPTVEPGISTALNYLSSMLYGAVIALAYFSPAAAWFHSRQPADPPPHPLGGAAMGSLS
jgi:hypothetical protein